MTANKIIARFATVLEALEASKIDIEYNPAAARAKATDAARPNRHYALTGPVMLCEDGEIYFTVTCFDGLVVLNKFDPFISCLDNSAFVLCTITEDAIQTHETLTFPKSARKALAKIPGIMVK